jgi:hypothetical protein
LEPPIQTCLANKIRVDFLVSDLCQMPQAMERGRLVRVLLILNLRAGRPRSFSRGFTLGKKGLVDVPAHRGKNPAWQILN